MDEPPPTSELPLAEFPLGNIRRLVCRHEGGSDGHDWLVEVAQRQWVVLPPAVAEELAPGGELRLETATRFVDEVNAAAQRATARTGGAVAAMDPQAAADFKQLDAPCTGPPWKRPPVSGEVLCRSCALKLVTALLATGLTYWVHEVGNGYQVCWLEDPRLPVVGGDRRRLTIYNRDQMTEWCGGREPGDAHSDVMLMGQGVCSVMVAPGDIVERLPKGCFRVHHDAILGLGVVPTTVDAEGMRTSDEA